jgi:hypothetical protein
LKNAGVVVESDVDKGISMDADVILVYIPFFVMKRADLRHATRKVCKP